MPQEGPAILRALPERGQRAEMEDRVYEVRCLVNFLRMALGEIMATGDAVAEECVMGVQIVFGDLERRLDEIESICKEG